MFNPKPTVRIPFLPCLKPFIQSGRNMAFFAGAIFAILTIFTVLDKDVLLAEHVLTVIATLGKQLSFRCNWVTLLTLTLQFPLHSGRKCLTANWRTFILSAWLQKGTVFNFSYPYKSLRVFTNILLPWFFIFSGLLIRGCYVFIPDEVGIWFIS